MNATSCSFQPASDPNRSNSTRIATNSSPVVTMYPSESMTNDARYCIWLRTDTDRNRPYR